MKKEEIEKYCKKYSGINKLIVRELGAYLRGPLSASHLFKKVESFKKKHKLKDISIEFDVEDDSLEFRGEKLRTQKEILVIIKELKEQEEVRKRTEEQHKKNRETNELKEYKKLHKKYGKK